MSDIIERLRKTASRGVSVWGDLQMEAADELERLRAEIAKPALEPVEFLMYGARFKLNFNGKGNCTTFQNLVHDLQGRWVALVSAENDKHLANAQPAPAVPTDLMLAASAASAAWKSYWQRHRAYSAAVDFAKAMTALDEAIAAQPAPAPEELSPEFTDTARAALLWVLWHHQGASSAVGQPIRFALGMGAHDRLNEHQIAEAKRWATTTGSTTAEFHKVPAAPAVPADMTVLIQRTREAAHWQLIEGNGDDETHRALIAAADALERLSAAPAVREPHEPYLCIKPACGPDCSGCNCAISPQDMRDYAIRYAILRNAPINAIRGGGVFAGKTPDNVVINGEHLDAAVDALRGITGDSK